MIGDFDAFRNRQKRDESNKTSLRNKIRTKKKGLVDDANYNVKDEFDLPDVSKAELEQIKIEIRNKIQKEKRTRIIITLVITFMVFAVIFYLIKKAF